MNRFLAPLLAALLAAAAAAGLAIADRDGHHHQRGASYALGLWGDLPYSDLQTATGVPNLVADMNRRVWLQRARRRCQGRFEPL